MKGKLGLRSHCPCNFCVYSNTCTFKNINNHHPDKLFYTLFEITAMANSNRDLFSWTKNLGLLLKATHNPHRFSGRHNLGDTLQRYGEHYSLPVQANASETETPTLFFFFYVYI